MKGCGRGWKRGGARRAREELGSVKHVLALPKCTVCTRLMVSLSRGCGPACRAPARPQASLEEKTSTADMAEALEEAGAAALRQRGGTGAGGPGGEGPGSGDADEDEFESASENEYDPDKEEGDATAALERAAVEAAAAAAAAEEADAMAAVESANGANGGLLGPDDARDSSGAASRSGASPPRPGGGGGGGGMNSARASQSGDGAGLGPSSSSGLPKLDGSAHGGGKAQSGGSFFSMSALNSMGKLLRISQVGGGHDVAVGPRVGKGGGCGGCKDVGESGTGCTEDCRLSRWGAGIRGVCGDAGTATRRKGVTNWGGNCGVRPRHS